MGFSATRRNLLRLSGATAGALLVPSGLRPRPAHAADKVPVGSLLDQTGAINISGLPAIAGTKFAVDEINRTGGLLGKQLQLIQYDTQSDISKYTQFAKKMILDDGVVVIHAGITSASREAIRPIIDEQEALYF